MEQSLPRAESASILSEIASPPPPPVLVTLRRGEQVAPLYLFPGTSGEIDEIAALARRLTCPNPVVGVEYAACGSDDGAPLTVKSIARRCVAEIRGTQALGPYYLAGYSFGGLVAVEVARLLSAEAQEVGLLVLIDTIYDRRFWPMTLFLKSQCRRAFWHLKKLTARAPGAALAELGMRAHNLLRRVGERFTQSATDDIAVVRKGASVMQQCTAAIATYQPSRYDGAIIVISPESDDDFGCRPALLWHKYSDFVSGITIPGTHLDTVRNPESISRLAVVIGNCLAETSVPAGQPKQPRVLVINAFRWFSAAHAARSFHDAGAIIDVLCPRSHALTQLPFVNATYSYSTLRPLSSLRAAITASQPDLLIPCDDQVTLQLHQLYESTESGDPLRPLLARSLGSPDNFRLFYSRDGVVRLAQDLDVPCPEAAPIAGMGELRHKLDAFGLPAVLKIDGSSGGRGVAVVGTVAEAERAFVRLRTWPGFARALKHLLVNGNATLIKRVLGGQKNTFSLQKYIEGRPANAAVACWQGKVLAAVLVEVLESDGPTGPATVVRVITHPGMTMALERMVEKLKLSGLCGFDFVLRASDGSALFIELNPRATPTCHLVTAEGNTLSAALCGQLRGDASASAGLTPILAPIALSPRNHRGDV